MQGNKPTYKVVWNPVQYRPEFLMAQATRQAELIMQIRKIDDDMAEAERRVRYAQQLTPLSYIPIPIAFGTIIGALVGLLIASSV